jgi:hypothetical protein
VDRVWLRRDAVVFRHRDLRRDWRLSVRIGVVILNLKLNTNAILYRFAVHNFSG